MVSGSLLQLITSFLNGRLQRVRLNCQTWDWETIPKDVPQGSNLGHLFSLYM